jgi:hypothetical protein
MSRQNGVQPTERANIVVVSVRLSKADAALCQEKAGRLGVGISTYIRMLVRQHLEQEGAYRGSAKGEEAVDPFSAALDEVAAADADALPRIRTGRPVVRLSAQSRTGTVATTMGSTKRAHQPSRISKATSPGPSRSSS